MSGTGPQAHSFTDDADERVHRADLLPAVPGALGQAHVGR